jgi:hypothetical protein
VLCSKGQTVKRGSSAVILIIALMNQQAIANSQATLHVCIKHVAHKDDDFADDFAMGSIVVPAGAVFDAAGHAFGPASDPLDSSHMKDGGGWMGISNEESNRRDNLLLADNHADNHLNSGLVTLLEIALTKRHPCAAVPVAAVVSQKWGWTTAPIFGSSAIYFQLYGIIKAGELDTSFRDTRDPLDSAGAGGQINGILLGTTERTVPVR